MSTNKRDWDSADRFTDHSKKYVARILCWADGKVHVSYRSLRGRDETHAALPEKYWLSPACGWQRCRSLEAPK